MSKKEVMHMSKLEQIMAEKGTPTLKAFAAVFDMKPMRFYSVAKQPKEGVVYDAKVFNWEAIERFITRRLDPEKGLATLEDVVDQALEADEELKKADGRRSGNHGEGSAYGAKIEVDGKMVAKRRFSNFEKDSGKLIVLKKDPEVYAIVMQTASHTVIRPVNSAAPEDFKGNDVKVISNGMLNHKGIGPSGLDAAIADRFSGEYAKRMAKEAAKAAADAAAKAEAAAPTTE